MPSMENSFRKGTGSKYSSFVRYRNISILFFIAVVAVSLILFRGNLQESVYVEAQTDSLYLKSYTGEQLTIPYKDIRSVTLTGSFEEGTMISGTDNARVHSGQWENESLGQYSLFVARGIDVYLILGTDNMGYAAFNYESDETTRQIYTALQDLMEKKGLESQVTYEDMEGTN